MVEGRKPEDMCMDRPAGHGPEYAKEWEAFREFKNLCMKVDRGTFKTYSEEVQNKIIANVRITANQGIPCTPRLAGMAFADKKAAQNQLARLTGDA